MSAGRWLEQAGTGQHVNIPVGYAEALEGFLCEGATALEFFPNPARSVGRCHICNWQRIIQDEVCDSCYHRTA